MVLLFFGFDGVEDGRSDEQVGECAHDQTQCAHVLLLHLKPGARSQPTQLTGTTTTGKSEATGPKPARMPATAARTAKDALSRETREEYFPPSRSNEGFEVGPKDSLGVSLEVSRRVGIGDRTVVGSSTSCADEARTAPAKMEVACKRVTSCGVAELVVGLATIMLFLVTPAEPSTSRLRAVRSAIPFLC